MDRDLEAHAALNVLEMRIRTLWHYRQWFHRYPWAAAVFHRKEFDLELRALVRILRESRRIARKAQERTDPMTIAKAGDPTLALGDHFAGLGHLPSSRAAR